MKKFTIITLLLAFGVLAAQEQATTPSRWVFGGGLGMNFGNNGFFGVNVSPSAGYFVTNNLEVGAQAGYNYSKNDFIRQNLFNVGPYANYYIGSFFGRGSYAFHTGNSKPNNGNSRSVNESALWLGGGISQRIGNVGRINFGIMYNALYDENNSIFGSAFQPFGGVVFGI